ncbi:MAG: peptidase S9, partial [Proteobacteria bacterium]
REKAVAYWREGEHGEERVLIDPNTLSDDGSVSLGGTFPSHDGRLVAYTLKANNADEATLYLRDLDRGEDSAIDVISGAKYAYPTWEPGGRAFYYTWLPASGDVPVADRPGYSEIRRHVVGTPPATDAQVFPRTGSARTFLWPSLSRDGRWLFLYVQHGWNSSDVWFRDLQADVSPTDLPAAARIDDLDTARWIATNARARGFRALAVGVDANYSVEAHGGRFYILTNDGAPRYRVMVADPAAPERAAWKEIIPESDETIEAVDIIGGRLVLRGLRAAASVLRVHDLDGARLHDVALPDVGTVDVVHGEPDAPTAYLSFSSYTTPPEVHSLDVASGETALWSRVDLPIDTSRFKVTLEHYRSHDGTRVSMFIVHRKDIALNGDNPTLLYGYGGFNVSMTPSYASSILIWLERGGVYALPHLRGGGEYGEAWHYSGRGPHKQNVFDDFIAAAEHLIARGYTRPERLAIRGGSNGGLLVGAAMTQRPDLFRAVICAVPLLDMVRYHLFGSGETWVPEYGSADDAEQLATLLAYSPYHRVKRGQRYPALLMMAADSDDRVDPLHARKFTAAIQWASASDRPALMRVERQAGHGGADLVKETVESYADQWAFLLWQLEVGGQ